jgi:hypothetical protein
MLRRSGTGLVTAGARQQKRVAQRNILAVVLWMGGARLAFSATP